ncbi:MAG: hypothetical protein AAGI36_13885 [Pseudomonadota bacterium]
MRTAIRYTICAVAGFAVAAFLFCESTSREDSKTLFVRLVSAPGSSLKEVFPEADMVCVVGQYKSTGAVLEPYGVNVSFWEGNAALENEVLLVLIKDLKVISEQIKETIAREKDGEDFSLSPENTCFRYLEARIEITTGIRPPFYSNIDGKSVLTLPSVPYTYVKIIR